MKNNKRIRIIQKDRRMICRSVFFTAAISLLFLCVSCTRYEPASEGGTFASENETEKLTVFLEESVTETEPEAETPTAAPVPEDTRIPVRVKALYLASKPVGNTERMDQLISIYDKTELNAVVIDIKDDYGKITYQMENVPEVIELESIESCIDDLPGLLQKFKEHDIYCIARIVTMRDPHLARVKPEWMLTKQDGTIYKDNSGYPWVNPYKEEYWEFLRKIAVECGHAGFQEIQFDYFRFCTDKGADDCIFLEEDVKDRDKITVITELAQYLSSALKEEGLFMAVDVFGTIIRSRVDSRSVGQDYAGLAGIIDYICPMVYPSHYANTSFGLDHPDLYPYDAILGALKRSRTALAQAEEDSEHVAIVRPWLQAFTATWLGSGNYRKYGAEEIRQEIQAVYDAGYDEWILWSPSVTYDFDGFLSKEEAKAEEEMIRESRANMPTEEALAAEETFPKELQEALDGDELFEKDEKILLEDGPVIQYQK